MLLLKCVQRLQYLAKRFSMPVIKNTTVAYIESDCYFNIYPTPLSQATRQTHLGNDYWFSRLYPRNSCKNSNEE